jgi:hypothetical protein
MEFRPRQPGKNLKTKIASPGPSTLPNKLVAAGFLLKHPIQPNRTYLVLGAPTLTADDHRACSPCHHLHMPCPPKGENRHLFHVLHSVLLLRVIFRDIFCMSNHKHPTLVSVPES